MKRTRRICTVLGMVFIVSCIMSMLGITASASKVTPTEARHSVVMVVREDGESMGSGFAIGEIGKPVEYIVTNNHVVRGEWGYTTAVVYFSYASDEKMLANIYFYDEEKDIAVLKLPEKTTKRQALMLCPMKYVNLNDSFAALGFPGNQETDWPKYSEDDITITKGGIKKSDRVGGQDVYMLDLSVTRGNSGGPLINSDGEVVGINTFGLNDDNYAIAIDELLNVINTDRIPVSVHTSHFWLYAIIGGGVLLLLLILVLVLVLARRNSGGEPQTPPVMADERIPQPQPAPKISNGVRVIAVGGTLNGRKYNVNGTIKIGRDASRCGIAFPVNTQGVSAVHCEIVFDGSSCYLKDLNSSYGTYTVNGTKLAPHAPIVLQSGDKFYLASPENMFEVRF